MKVTAKEVAQAAGVSQATASMVFRGKEGVSEETRRRVLGKAMELGFRIPTPQQSTRVIQIVVFKRHGKLFTENPFMEILIQGVTDRAMKMGYHPSIFYFYRDKNHIEQLNNMLTMHSVGIILIATEMDDRDMDIFKGVHIPLVLLDNYSTRMRWDSVLISNFYGIREATLFLIQNGFRRLGYLQGKTEIRNFKERYRGYASACKTLSEREARDSIRRVVPLEITVNGAMQSMLEYLKGDPVLPQAFVADNDYIAAGCCRALIQAGYRIPEQISVIGFDDSPVCQELTPPMTTMCVNKEQMGALAVNRLDERIHATDLEVTSTSIMPQLTIRQSVKLADPALEFGQ